MARRWSGTGNDWILVLDDVARNYPPPGSKDDPQTLRTPAKMLAAGPAPSVNPPAPGVELLLNGGFEQGTTAWALNGAGLAAGEGVKGGAALVIQQSAWRTAEQRIAARPKTRYTVSGQLRGQACTATVGIMIFFVDETGHELGRRLVSPANRGTPAYQRYTVEAVAPSNARFLDVRLYSSDGGTGRVFFDEVSVVAAAEATRTRK